MEHSKQTRDRCNVQLYHRMFQGCPNLRPGVGDINTELDVLSGTNSTTVTDTCKMNITEQQTYKMIPMLDCVAEVQKVENVVPKWIRGGEDTRNYVNRKNFLEKCGSFQQRQGTWIA